MIFNIFFFFSLTISRLNLRQSVVQSAIDRYQDGRSDPEDVILQLVKVFLFMKISHINYRKNENNKLDVPFFDEKSVRREISYFRRIYSRFDCRENFKLYLYVRMLKCYTKSKDACQF